VGSVTRNSIWRGNTVADLPGLPRPVEVFVLAVVLTMWDVAAASAATTGALEPPPTQPISTRAPGEDPAGELRFSREDSSNEANVSVTMRA